MFWDRVAAPYDLFETIYNGKVYRGTGEAVAKEIEPGAMYDRGDHERTGIMKEEQRHYGKGKWSGKFHGLPFACPSA